MKGERQQDFNRDSGERPFKYSAADRALGIEMSQAASVASAAAEFITGEKRSRSAEPPSRAYLKRTGDRPAFLVLREGSGDRPLLRDEPGPLPAGPCLIRSEEWMQTPELAGLCECWLNSGDALQAERALQRIYYRLRAASAALLESADSVWAAVTLLHTPELAARPTKLAELQDVQLEALFAAVAANQRLGSDSRIDLLAAYPASAAEFAAQRELLRTWPSRPSATLTRRRAASGR